MKEKEKKEGGREEELFFILLSLTDYMITIVAVSNTEMTVLMNAINSSSSSSSSSSSLKHLIHEAHLLVQLLEGGPLSLHRPSPLCVQRLLKAGKDGAEAGARLPE